MMALRELGKLDSEIEAESDFRIYIDADLLMQIYPSWHDKGVLPLAGGTLDQPDTVMYALNYMKRMVLWEIQNQQKDDPEDLPQI